MPLRLGRPLPLDRFVRLFFVVDGSNMQVYADGEQVLSRHLPGGAERWALHPSGLPAGLAASFTLVTLTVIV